MSRHQTARSVSFIILTNSPRLDPPKRRKPLLLEAPTADDDIPEANRYQYKSRDSHSTSEAIGAADSNAEEDQRDEGSRASTQGEEDDGEDDDFARMVSYLSSDE